MGVVLAFDLKLSEIGPIGVKANPPKQK